MQEKNKARDRTKQNQTKIILSLVVLYYERGQLQDKTKTRHSKIGEKTQTRHKTKRK